MTSKLTREGIEWLNYAATGLAANGTEMAMSPQDVIALTEYCLARMGSKPVVYASEETLAYAENGELLLRVLSQPSGDAIIPLYRHAEPNQEYPETLPCPVLLEPGMRFGKGVKTRLVLYAIQRRAEHYAELDAMTPEERAEHDANIEAFKAMLPQPAQVVPETAHSSVIAEQLAHVLSGLKVTDHQRAVISCAVDRLNNVAQLLQLSPSALLVPDILDYQGAKELYNYLMTEEETNATVNGRNACRAAMLAAAPQLPDNDHATVPDRWIPVSERMPEDDGFVYIWPRPDFGVELHVGQYCECSPKGDGWYAQVYEQNYGIDWYPITVTHWMPLPASPQEVQDE